MNLVALIAAVTAITSDIRIQGPYSTPQGFEIVVNSDLGDGREVVIGDDGVARWVTAPAGGPRRVHQRQLPFNAEKAAEAVVGLVWSA